MSADKQYEAAPVEYDLKVHIVRRGHVVPLANGLFVQLIGCWYSKSNVDLYAKLSYGAVSRVPPPDRLRMRDAGVGSIVHHEYHVDELDLTRAELGPHSATTGLRTLDNVFDNLWYYIAFRAGLYWARYDWIELVRSPAGPEAR